MALTPEQRSQRARIAALSRWAGEDPRPATERARRGFDARFLDQVDPDRILPEHERERRAAAAMRAHMQRLALKSSRARGRRTGEAPADAAEHEGAIP